MIIALVYVAAAAIALASLGLGLYALNGIRSRDEETLRPHVGPVAPRPVGQAPPLLGSRPPSHSCCCSRSRRRTGSYSSSESSCCERSSRGSEGCTRSAASASRSFRAR